MDFKPEQLLGDAIEAARRAMRELEADQIPASVRRVAGYSGGSLPPPFARSLLAELDTNEFLRTKALEAWQLDRPPSGVGRLASYRFLERGDGWLMGLLSAGYSLGSANTAVGEKSDQIERNAHEAEVTSLKERLKAARQERDGFERDLRELLRTSREPVRQGRESERRRQEQMAEAERLLSSKVERLEARLAAVQRDLDIAREAARADRQLRADAEAAHRSAVAPEAHSVDSEVLAARLDVLAVLATAGGPAPKVDAGGEGASHETLTYPTAVRPDSAEAVDWLASSGEASVFVDGYNVGFLLANHLDPARARMLVQEAVGRLRLAARKASIVVVFDSEIPLEEGASSSRASRDVVFSSGRSADDEIVARAASASNPVVITNDREVRDRAEAVGAITLWADALAAWSRRR